MTTDLCEVLLVHRCVDMKRAPVAVGTIACGTCREECWIARTSIDLIATVAGMKIMCTRCLDSEDVQVDEVRAVPGSIREIHELLAQPNYVTAREAINRKRSS